MRGGSLRLLENRDDRLAVLAVVGSLDSRAKGLTNLLWAGAERESRNGGRSSGTPAHLETVADAEDGNAVGEHVRINVGSIAVVDGVGRAGEDDSCAPREIGRAHV